MTSVSGTGSSPATAASPYAVPGWMIDLITDGVKTYGMDYGRQANAVLFAVRKVMYGAHQNGIDWTYLRGLLTDVDRRRLALQISDYFGAMGRSGTKRNTFLRDQWADTGKAAAKRPKWTQAEIDGFIAYVRSQLGRTESMSARDQAVIEFAVLMAEKHRMMRPAITVRDLAAYLSTSNATADRVIKRIAKERKWLSMGVRGKGGDNPATRKATTWHLAPFLVPEYRAVQMRHRSLPSTYVSPTYVSPTSSPTDEEFTVEEAADEIVKMQGSPKALAEFVRLLQATDPALARDAEFMAGERSHRRLRVVEAGA